MKLWLDDIRPAPDGWRHVWNVQSMKEILVFNIDIEEISLDNDLGLGEDEGYKVLDWIEQKVVLEGYVPPIIHIHSANPVAAYRMQLTLQQIQMRLDEKNAGKNIIGE